MPRRPFSPLRMLLLVALLPLLVWVWCFLAAMTVAHRIGTGEWPSKDGCYS